MKNHLIINSEELHYYLADIRKIPVISHSRQDEIFDLLGDDNLSEKEKKKLRDELVLGNLRFVVSVSKSYQNQGLDILDLISEGNIGLIKAMERFDYTSGVRFISYAVWWVKQSMMAALNENARTIRIPSNSVQEEQKNKKRFDVDKSIYFEMKNDPEKIPDCISLSKEINDDGNQLIDIITDPNETNPETFFNSKEEIKKRVDKILSVLDEREKIIIEKSFGLNGVECNLESLGEEFDCTKERIRQLREKSLRKLRNHSYELFNLI